MKKGLCLLMLMLTGCASVAHQTTQQIAVDSQPAGAEVAVACGDVHNDARLVTPTVVTVHRKPAHCVIAVSKDGYQRSETKLGRSMSGWFLGNVLIGGIVGFIVDAANGAMYNRTPGNVSVTLASETAGEESEQK